MKKSWRAFLILFLVYIFCLYLGWQHFFYDCIPLDEGLIAHSADRVLSGEIPHINFKDPYSGLLNYLHVFAFKMFGIEVRSLRIFHFCVFSIFLPYLMFLFFRVTRSIIDVSLLTVVYTLWSVLIYASSMPSWYLNYFSFLGISFLILFRKSILSSFFSGVFFALATMVKINAIIFAMGYVWGIFLLSSKNSISREIPYQSILSSSNLKFFYGVTSLSVLLFILRHNIDYEHISYFIIPYGIGVFVVSRYVTTYFNMESLRLFLSFSFGYLTLVFIWFGFYYFNDGISALIQGLFVTPFKRTMNAAVAPWISGIHIPIAVVFCIAFRIFRKGKVHRIFIYLFFGIISFFLCLLSYLNQEIALKIILLIFTSLPLGMLLKILLDVNKTRQKPLIFLYWVLCTFLVSWIQYPWFGFAYLSYVLSFYLMALCYFYKWHENYHGKIFFRSFLILMIFSGFSINVIPSKLGDVNNLFDREVVCVYDELLTLIRDETSLEDSIIAFPDAAHIYFYSRKNNPTQYTCDVFYFEGDQYSEYINVIKEHNIPLVVINNTPCCNLAPGDDVKNYLRSIFLNEIRIEEYDVFYRRERK
jgi:hypothetical protein